MPTCREATCLLAFTDRQRGYMPACFHRPSLEAPFLLLLHSSFCCRRWLQGQCLAVSWPSSCIGSSQLFKLPPACTDAGAHRHSGHWSFDVPAAVCCGLRYSVTCTSVLLYRKPHCCRSGKSIPFIRCSMLLIVYSRCIDPATTVLSTRN